MRMRRRISLCLVAPAFCPVWIGVDLANVWAQRQPSPSIAQPQAPESLKGKSDEELIHILLGGKSAWKLEAQERRANEVATHLPDRFWEMPPKDAALALVE